MAAVVDVDLVHLDECFGIQLVEDFLLILRRGEVTIVVRIAGCVVHALDILGIEEVGDVEIDVEEGGVTR